jgi:hypothetical protein
MMTRALAKAASASSMACVSGMTQSSKRQDALNDVVVTVVEALEEVAVTS